MNTLEIREFINKLVRESETKLEEVYARMLREILNEIMKMYSKYQRNGVLSYTDLNKFNRLHNIFERINETLSEDYKVVVKEIRELTQTTYLETYLREAYVTEVFASIDMGFQIPSVNVINEMLKNPVEKLRLPKTMQAHRNQIVDDIQIIVTQGLIRGDSYWDMAKEIEKKVGFFTKKAQAVARTEAGRAQSIAADKVMEQAGKFAKITKVWASALDFRVRTAHRILDGQRADKEGYFHYKGLKAKGPHMWMRADMDINCRCIVIHLVNGQLPQVRRGRDYRDPDYQDRFQKAVERYMKKDGLTFAQAISKANKYILPPNKEFKGYITHEQWREIMTS